MQELQELLDFLKSKGLTNVKIPIDMWCGIIEFYAQKSNNLASSEPKPLANNKQTQERQCKECKQITDDFMGDNTICEICLCPEWP